MKEISAKELATVLNKDMKVIDVREENEYAMGHIPVAKNIPLGTIPEADFSKDETYYIICRSGGRSMRACQYLANQGVDVVNVQGGMLSYTGPTTR